MSKGDLTREHIVAKAAPIFNKSGFAGTSLSDLMAATGLQKGGIYRHFTSKEELAAAAFEHAWARVWSLRWTGIDEKANAVDQLSHFVANFVEKRGELVQGGCPVMNTAIDSDDGNITLRELACRALRRWMKRIADIVSTGIERNEIRKDVDPQATATIIVATLEGALMIGRLQNSGVALQQTRDYLDGFLRGLAPARASKKKGSAS